MTPSAKVEARITAGKRDSPERTLPATLREDFMSISVRHLAAAALAAAALVSVRPAVAQGGPGGSGNHMVQIGFGGGMSVPTSHAADALKSGVNGQAYLLLNIGIPIRINLGYQKFDYKSALLGASGATSGQSTMMSGIGGIQLNLVSIGPLGTYVTAGLGAFNVKDELTNVSGTTSSSNLNWGIDGGAGITLKLGRLQAFAEGRVQNIYTDKGAIDTKTITAIPVTFGVLF
jgi:hypothetical protein